MRNIILLGAPGSGKGTQSEKIIAQFYYNHVSTGDIIRDNIRNNTAKGNLAKKYSEQGKLVPDDLMIEMLEDYLQTVQGDIIWDGFPRTVNQAEKLDELLAKRNAKVDHTLYFEIAESKLIDRITGRLTCPTCKRTYHITFHPPKVTGICDYDQTPLVRRADDTAEKVQVRLAEYKRNTEPLVQYYLNKQNLSVVDVDMEGDAVWNQIIAIIK